MVSCASDNSATFAVSRSFSALSSDSVSDDAPALATALPTALKGAEITPPSMRTGEATVITMPRSE